MTAKEAVSMQCKATGTVSESAALRGAVTRGAAWLCALQNADGSFTSRYGGPMFLTPMYVLGMTVMERPIDDSVRQGILRYFRSTQREDGSVGLHEEGAGCVFTTVLTYVAARLLEVPKGDPAFSRMRQWILRHGTALGAASWGKAMLALVDLYPYEGLNPALPELWLLPYAMPIHPGRLWCHSRMVYLPMAYCYGAKVKRPADALIRAIREEIYDEPYESIDFSKHRARVADEDNLSPMTAVGKLAFRALSVVEKFHSSRLRRRALKELYEQICFEDETTNGLDIGPVNSILNAVVHHVHAPGSAEETRCVQTLSEYLCETEKGLHFNGYNSTALWDTAFAAQALGSAGLLEAHGDTAKRAHDFIDRNQVREDVPDKERHYRHASKGGWPFSDARHGWPITDCTAEGYKTARLLAPHVDAPIAEDRLLDSVELLLSFQNEDGGWASYERQRAGRWLEGLNPSQVFCDIMADYSYIECTSACLQALIHAEPDIPASLRERIRFAVRHGVAFLLRRQGSDGSFQGSWAVCFTYGAWFALTALRDAGLRPEHPTMRRAAEFLLAHQNDDGGFGEDARSCLENRWVKAESHVVQTSWALLALCAAGCGKAPQARRAALYLKVKQNEDGEWPRQAMVGMFNKTTVIDYDNYRHYFPIWALSAYEGAQG